MAGGPMDLWNHWSIQIVVLVSLTLQVALLVLAGIRRREAHPVLTFLLWSAYSQADFTAIYALGHLSFSSVPREHRLVAFWAPFLLMHLGGPDNITAYALQDSQLWLRQLWTLVLKVLGAAIVLYKHIFIASTGTFVQLAAILISAVGVVKYAERTWALKCGNMGSIRSSLEKKRRTKYHFYIEDEPPQGGFNGKKADEEEFLVRYAHSLFHICKCAVVDSSIGLATDDHDAETFRRFQKKGNHKGLDDHDAVIALMEIELSLLYDILYTKAAVIHSMFGYFIRAASPVAITASLLLFHFSGKDGHSGVDVAITYVLLAGAFLLEMTSLLRALGSSWTLAFLCATRWSWIRHAALCDGRWDRLRRVVVSLHHFVNITRISTFFTLSRRWSGTMGQYNMLHRCTGSDSLTILGRLAKMLGRKEWWNRWHYSGTVPIPEDVKEWVYKHTERIISQDDVNTLGIIRNDWGKKTLLSHLKSLNVVGLECLDEDRFKTWDIDPSGSLDKDRPGFLGKVLNTSLGAEFQEGIIIWHIGTDVFLARSSRAIGKAEDAAARVKAIRALSNYMMFLLVERPDMLPGLAQTRLYNRTYDSLVQEWRRKSGPSRRNFCTMLQELFRRHDDPSSTSRLQQRERFARMLLENKPHAKGLLKLETTAQETYDINSTRLHYAIELAEGLLKLETEHKYPKFDSLGLVRDMWTDFLVYPANRCSRESHAKKLSTGGELTTVIWLNRTLIPRLSGGATKTNLSGGSMNHMWILSSITILCLRRCCML